METTIKQLRRRILDIALRDEMGHIPSALSILDIIWVLYDKVMKSEDTFVLSKGHGCMALYAVLEEKGLMGWSDKLWGHPKRGGAITASTGSLGHGLPMAVGMALAKKIKDQPGRVFCVIGDGECNEGTIWESALLASHHELDNLVVICDWNKSSERALKLGDLTKKFHAFGFSVWNVYGHSHSELKMSMDTATSEHDKKPLMIIADTNKGNGIDMMRDDPSWHNKKITKEIYESIIS